MALSDARAAQTDIPGDLGSVAFGTFIAVLPNGNIVVVDPNATGFGPVYNEGAVFLFSPAGNLISKLTGSMDSDHVGSGGIFLVGGGNFVVASPQWTHPNGGYAAGAATWVNGTTGLNGAVSPANSLVGTTESDKVANGGITVLSNGNYVISSYVWNPLDYRGLTGQGAATWGNGTAGVTGAVSASNSLVGTGLQDQVGLHVTALGNGNYVVGSPYWSNAPLLANGAATWANGATGLAGAVSTSNSLVGTTTGDHVGASITALSNGNYVVASPDWNNTFGAATWGNGNNGLTGIVFASNSLVGSTAGDAIGSSTTALGNGNYVVSSILWSGYKGAASWANGATGLPTGTVSAANSLVGTAAYNYAGNCVTALTNGNYVVCTPGWNSSMGAVTWGNGTVGVSGNVSAGNSLIGTAIAESTGSNGVTALSNGNYVVSSPLWGAVSGAATWANGTTGLVGTVSASNSFVGTVPQESVGYYITALSNGNYVIGSPRWSGNRGAATWANGATGITGTTSAGNSLVGSVGGSFGDSVGSNVTALSNGNYVAGSPYWNGALGAMTWANGATGRTGVVSALNSLTGTYANDRIDYIGATALGDGHYVVPNRFWNGGDGAVTLASANFRLAGTIQGWNSVRGNAASGGVSMVFAYDPARKSLVVGRPADQIVSVFTMEQVFADNFE